ncbi:MAG: right-handed parallel beta-helix repeat-containing protein, partial [Chloroflexi bacterium]|nr:right-handed parallel beta-helix repeat-containing protein [Chloroflexota bacterium]
SGNYVDDNYDIENLKPIPHGGIVLNAIQNARLQGNTANGNVAGMQILNSSKIRVQQNIASRNRGWGIYLYGTTASVIYTNTVDYNNRTCPRPGGGTWEGCGSAGIVLTQQSDRNIIGWNILTANGNGIYQGNTPASASNDLEIRNNKISNSIANGIEATFSWRNYIHDNEFSDDDYGAWLGYSRDGRFEFNTVKGSRSRSVQVDNGQGWKVFDNTIVRRDAIDDRFDGRDILFQPVQGGTCKNNQFSNNKPISVTIETPGCQ